MLKALAVFPVGLALVIGSPAMAEHHEDEAPKAEVIARDDKGRATRISVEGIEVDVCSAEIADNCINPREAGLDFGIVPLDSWPGRPASAGPVEPQSETSELPADSEAERG
jgi:hypothetical protein